MRVGLRMLKPTTVESLRGKLQNNTPLTRSELARQLRERDNWHNARGNPCAASARKGLPALAASLGLPLPDATRPTGGCQPRHKPPPASLPAVEWYLSRKLCKDSGPMTRKGRGQQS